MAIGTNTLGLLFKLGVDAGDAQQQISGLRKLLNDLGTSFKEGLGQGAIQGAKDVEKALSSTQQALGRFGGTLNQTRAGLESLFRGDVIGGTTQLLRNLGPIAVGLGAVAVAGLAVKKSIEGILDVAHKVGTDSKEDFEALQKSMARVGEQVTLLDHGLSQELVKAAGDVKTAFDAMFLEMLRKEGPALILLFKTIVNFIHDVLIPATDTWVKRQVEGIVQFIGLVRGLQAIQNLPEGLMGTDLRDFGKIIQSYVAQTRKELEALTTTLAGTTGTFEDHTKAVKTHTAALKDLTQAQLEEKEAARDLALLRAKAAELEADINRELKAEAITADEALARRLAIQQNLFNAERDLLDAEKKRIEAEVKGENNRTNALEENANKREILERQDAARQKELAAQADADWTKYTEKRLKQLDTILKRGQEVADAVVKAQAQAAQAIPGAGVGGDDRGLAPIPGVISVTDALKQLPVALKSAMKDLSSLLSDLHQEMVRHINDAIQMGGAWGGFIQTLKELFSLKNIGDQFVLMMQSVLDVFIQTGHTGPAVLRQLVAGVLRAIATMSAEWGTFFLLMAIGFAALGDWADAAKFAVAGAGLWALAAGLGFAASKVGPSQAGAAAGAGTGFGGGDTTPSQVNIGLGGGANTLAISTAQFARAQIDAINNLNNKISSMSPGDVVTVAADQKPEAFATGTLEAGRRSGAFTREFMQISGARA